MSIVTEIKSISHPRIHEYVDYAWRTVIQTEPCPERRAGALIKKLCGIFIQWMDKMSSGGCAPRFRQRLDVFIRAICNDFKVPMQRLSLFLCFFNHYFTASSLPSNIHIGMIYKIIRENNFSEETKEKFAGYLSCELPPMTHEEFVEGRYLRNSTQPKP